MRDSSVDPPMTPRETNGPISPSDHLPALKRANGPNSESDHLVPLRIEVPFFIRTESPGSDDFRFAIESPEQVLLHRAEELLDRQLTVEDLCELFTIGLRTWVACLEKRRKAAIPKLRPRCVRRASARGVRGVILRAVWERDAGQCTFVGSDGDRCTGRRLLEFGRIGPIAPKIETKTEHLRLLCRPHFLYEAGLALAAAGREQGEPSP